MEEPTPDQENTGGGRRWLRRLAWVAAVCLVLVLLLVLVLPALLTSRFATARYASFASNVLERPVEIEGLRFGWRTPLSIRHIGLPATAGEHGYPAAVIEDVSVPLSLTGAIRGDWRAMEEIRVGRFEANLVRREDGEWNWLALASQLATDEEPEPKPDTEPSDEPLLLPIERFAFRVDTIALRVIDPEAGLHTGWEDGHLTARWDGGSNPFVFDTGGDFRLNDSRLPWSFQLEVRDLADASGLVDPEGARIMAMAPAGDWSEEAVEAGGFYLDAGMQAGSQNIVRLVLPLEGLAAFARGWEGAEAIPETAGTIDLRLTAEHDQEFGALDFDLAMVGRALRADLAETLGTELPEQDFDFTIRGSLDLTGERVRELAANLSHETLRLDLQARELPFADPGGAEELEATLLIALAETTALASRLSGGDGDALVDGTVRLAARLAGHDAYEVELDLLPGVLRSFGPFLDEHPEALQALPLDLGALGFSLALAVESHNEMDQWRVSSLRLTGDLVEQFEASGGTVLSTGAWDGEADVALRIETILAALGELIILEDLPDVAGLVRLRAEAQSPSPEEIITTGVLIFEGLSVTGEAVPLDVHEDEIRLEWDLTALPQSAAADLRRVALVTSVADLELFGQAGAETLDLKLSLLLQMERLAEVAADFLPPELRLHGGALQFDLALAGRLNHALHVGLELVTPEPIDLAQEGLFRFTDQLEMTTEASLEWLEGELASVEFDLPLLAIGSGVFLTATGALDMAGGTESLAELQIELDYGAMLGWIDPAMLEDFEAFVDLAGASELVTSAVFQLGHGPNGDGVVLTGPIEVEGLLVTEIAEVLWAFGEMEGYVEGLFDEREFFVSYDPDDPEALFAVTEAASGFGVVDGPMGLLIESLEALWTVSWNGSEGLALDLASLTLGETVYSSDAMVFALPELRLALVVQAPADFSRFDLEQLTLEADDLLDFTSTSFVNLTEGRWGTETALTIPDIRELFRYMPEDTELPDLRGGMRLLAQLEGALPGDEDEESSPTGEEGLPASGTLFAELFDFDVEMDTGMALQGMTAFLEVALPDGPGPLVVTTDASIVQFAHAAFANKPPRNIRWRAVAELDEMDRLDARIEEMSVENYAVNGIGFLTVDGLAAALESDEEGLLRWLDNLEIDGEMRLQQDLDGWTGFLDLMAMSGIADVTARLTSTPRASLRLNTLIDVQDVALVFGNILSLDGLDGSWEAAKSLRLSPAARVEPPPPAGRFTLRRLSVGPPGLELVARRSSLTARGFDGGFGLELESRDLMGGSATGGFTGSMRGTDPFLTGRMIFTGFDAGLLGGGVREATHDPDWELNGATTMTWRLREVAGDRFLEDIAVDLRSTRVGRDALARLLRTLDRDADDPRFQNAIVALRFGTPRSFSMQLEGAMLSMRSELGLRGGVRVPLPILDRQPLTEAMEVYQLGEFAPLVELTRFGLLMLLAPDIETVERVLAERAEP